MAKVKRAAVYLRVSRGEQSLDNQRPDVRRLARARKLKVVTTFEESVSATRARPEFKAMMNAAHRGDFDVLLVWSLDRLGRSMTGNLQAVLDLDRCGVEVISVREPWLDTGGPVRSLLIAIFGWVAEQERAQIAERTKAGIERARRKGIRLGRPKRRVDVRQAKRLRAKGLSFRDVARELDVPVSTLHRALRSKKGSDEEGGLTPRNHVSGSGVPKPNGCGTDRAARRAAVSPGAKGGDMIRLPVDPTDEELARDWTLSEEDLVEVRRCRGADKRHSFALQLCVLRRLGRFLSPDEYDAIPVRIMNHVGRQVGRPPVLLVTPPARKATDLEHEKRIRAHLGYCTLDDAARETLDVWMTERAARGLLADELVREAEEYLRLRRIVIPARSTLERMATRAATRTESDLLGTICERLTAEQRVAIDDLLDVPGHRSQLFALKQYPPEPTPSAIKTYLERAELLRDLGVGQIDLSGVRPEVVLHHAELVRRYDVDDLKRFKPAKCHALVACFLVEANKSVLDHLVEMHHVFTTGLHRRARNAYEKKQRELRQKSGRNLRLVLDALEALLGEDPDHVEQLDLDVVRGAIVGCRELQRLTERGEFEALRLRHHTLKRYLPGFLRLPFEGGPGTEPLIEAIEHARALHDQGTTDLGKDPPTEFATGLWKRGLARKLDVRSWELALAFAIRDALRSGDLYLADSRHHVSFWNLVQGPEQWAAARARAYREMGLPAEPGHALERLRTEFDAALHDFRDGLPDNRFAKVEAGALRLSRRDALDIPDRVQDLKRAIETHMPRIRIEDLLLEVDRWTGFTAELTAPSGYSERSATLRYPTLLAALVAHGTNLGTATMAQSTKDITVDMLQRTSKWCLHAEALKAANRVLVDHHHRLPFAGVWGDGTRSSSDGQRSGGAGSNPPPAQPSRVATRARSAPLLREPGLVSDRGLRRDHEQGQRPERALEQRTALEHEAARARGRRARGGRRQAGGSGRPRAHFALASRPRDPEWYLPIRRCVTSSP